MKLSTMLRLARVLLHVLQGMAICATVFPWLGQAQRNGQIRRWSRKLLLLCNVTVAQDGGALSGMPAPVLAQAMVVSNHVSWLDIFVIHSLYPSHFVAKAEIRSWPLAGWLAQKAGTVFIARGNRRDLRLIFEGLVATLQRGERVAFFPEGTTAAQGELLPFHANLFEAAIDAGVPVQPFALRYVDATGALHHSVDFIGEMTFAESIVAILDGPPVTARLAIMPAIATLGAHRRELAEVAHGAVAAALGIAAPRTTRPGSDPGRGQTPIPDR